MLSAALLATGLPAAAAPEPAPAAAPAPGPQRTLTLVTGDRVAVAADGVPTGFEPAPERAGTRYRRWLERGQWFVRPLDADPLVRSGRVDGRLFNISLLLEAGYEDGRRADVPLLVAGDPAARSRTAPQAPASTTRTRELPELGLSAVSAPKASAARAWEAIKSQGHQRSAGKVWLNATLEYTLHESVPLIGAPAAWQAGHTAKDVPVAVLDSGIDVDHPDFKDVLVEAKDFSNSEHGIKDTIGHGTHVASTVAGSGAAGGGKQVGVAKDARLFFGKVGDFGPTEDAVLAGMTWAAVRHRAKAVNMSFGLRQQQPDPVSEAVERLSAEYGTLFVIAAGNDGADESVGHPATVDGALAVASSTKDGKLSEFSSRGPRAGDYALKPEITAPGSDIHAAKADSAGGERYVANSGTSMAAPHVTGAAAVLAGQHPDWGAARLKAALMSTAKPLAGVSVYGQGAGVVDLARATKQAVTAEQGALSLGYFQWPHGQQPKVTKDVVYHNDSDQPVTLDLALSVVDKSGGAPDPGQFSLSAPKVTVPAKAKEKVSVTVDPNRRLGLYGGWLTATAGDTQVRTAVGAYVEEERYDLTVRVTGRDGKPANAEVTVSGLDNETHEVPEVGADGVVTVRAAKGEYLVTATHTESGPRGEDRGDPVALVQQVAPKVSLTGNTTIDADGRKAKPVRTELDDPELAVSGVELTVLHGKGSDREPGTTPHRAPYSVDTDAPVYLADLGGQAAHFRHLTHVTAVRPEVRAEVVAPTRQPLLLRRNEFSPLLTGTHELPVVDVKEGRPEDLTGKDLRGKLAVLAPPPGRADEQVKRVADAGAKAVVVVAPVHLRPTEVPLFTAAEQRLTALYELLGKGPVTVRVTGTPNSPVSYDLARASSGRMTDGALVRGRRGELSKVEVTYRKGGPYTAVRPTWRPALAGRAAAPWQESFPFRDSPPALPLGTTRTEYLTPGWWAKLDNMGDGTGRPPGGFIRHVDAAAAWYPHHGSTPRAYNAGLHAARPGPVYGAARFGDELSWQYALNSPQPGDARAPEQYSANDWDSTQGEVVLRRDGVEIGRSQHPASGYWKIPSGTSVFELTATGSRGQERYEAAWTFRATPPTGPRPERVRVLSVTPRVDLDETGTAPAGRPLPVAVRTTGGEGAVTTKLEVSVDGRTWREVPLRDDRGVLPAMGKAGDVVSLRLAAEDGTGLTARQVLHRAYVLR
ncbi:hypothetical protein JOF53_006671 [Crossiella equi]|uniref:Peptidase S8/S53 domain-containing protein n=1 Tax=Crossiella equi TaxID=130796 RepID=A0ABS5AMJ1_9PSEU|nr:S8 family serine peptidase [Crossiella equi]MBP2477799.1 hypothetical protein [Crossiella equi]